MGLLFSTNTQLLTKSVFVCWFGCVEGFGKDCVRLSPGPVVGRAGGQGKTWDPVLAEDMGC